MSIGKMIDKFLVEYNKAFKDEMVSKPVAYALYKTWKWADKMEKPREH